MKPQGGGRKFPGEVDKSATGSVIFFGPGRLDTCCVPEVDGYAFDTPPLAVPPRPLLLSGGARGHLSRSARPASRAARALGSPRAPARARIRPRGDVVPLGAVLRAPDLDRRRRGGLLERRHLRRRLRRRLPDLPVRADLRRRRAAPAVTAGQREHE